jgi:hypothetical protein
MEKERKSYIALVAKPEGKVPLGRRWSCFNCNDLGKCELSRAGTLDCFLYVILYDFRCRTEHVTFGAP